MSSSHRTVLAVPFMPAFLRSIGASLRATGPAPVAVEAFPELARPLSRPTGPPDQTYASGQTAARRPKLGAARALPGGTRSLPVGGSIAQAAFVAAVALMVSLGTGVWDPPQ